MMEGHVEGRGYEPETADELSEVLRASNKVIIRNSDGANELFRLPGLAQAFGRDKFYYHESAEHFSYGTEDLSGEHDYLEVLAAKGLTSVTTESLRGIIDFSPADQVVSVRAGEVIGNLNEELAKEGQCIPIRYSHGPWDGGQPSSIGGSISMNLPHALESKVGSWRDWVLGMTVVLADGTIARCGSRAVKNVAGYDVMKLMIGSRQSLAVVAEVVLRTYPLHALPDSQLQIYISRKEMARRQGLIGSSFWWIQRTLSDDFGCALSEDPDLIVAADIATRTLFALCPSDRSRKRFSGDWLIRSGCGEKNLEFTDPTQIRFMQRAKEIFDPTGKLNPGEMGIF
jgi:hypothetical protein